MNKSFKILFLIIASIVVVAAVNLTLLLQYLLITYCTTIILYFLSGLLIKQNHFAVFPFLFLLPLLALNVFALVANPLTFPVFSPITFILAILSFTTGSFTKRYLSEKKTFWIYPLLTITLLSFLYFSFYFTPHFLYSKSIKKISGTSTVYDKLDFSNLDGSPYQLNNLKNKTVLIDNWFLDCYQCILKLPSLQSLSEKTAGDSTIKIITVINGKIDTRDRVKAFLSKHPEINIPVLYDKFNSIKNIIKIDGYPIELIIGKDGFIKERHDGFNKDERIIYVTETFKKLTNYNK